MTYTNKDNDPCKLIELRRLLHMFKPLLMQITRTNIVQKIEFGVDTKCMVAIARIFNHNMNVFTAWWENRSQEFGPQKFQSNYTHDPNRSATVVQFADRKMHDSARLIVTPANARVISG